MIRMAPEPEQNTLLRKLHDALCECHECFLRKRELEPERIVVVPWQPQSAAHRNEPMATLEYGGVCIELGLTYVHSFCGSFEPASSFFEAAMVFRAALDEIERRMWREMARRKAKGGHG